MNRAFKMAVLGCTALSMTISQTAFAAATQTPAPAALSGTNASAMATTCTNAAAAHDTDGAGGDTWAGVVNLGTVSTTPVAGPTEVTPLSRTNISNIVGTGTLVPSAPYIANGPYRNGGSVNMFGDQRASAGYYPTSTYDYIANFVTTFVHPFSCDITQKVYHEAVYHPAVDIDHPAIGLYVVNGDFGDSEAAIRANCEAFSAQQPADPLVGTLSPSWWGQDHGGNDNNGKEFHCKFVGAAAYHEHHDAYTTPAYYTDGVALNETQTALNQDQTNSLSGHEANGGRVEVSGDYFIGQVVICISPSTTDRKGVPGAWRTQNGYNGGNLFETSPATAGCNTVWFKAAPWGGGSQTSNGTYISVPFY